ncbi:uncharacterized protein LOC134819451 isoform X2 [Bolinopsis microptera]|uniref:uncharacterized protein LOC134819451 isoform X1 n=1 Tax=Bolinopsis microptera TaxID=2820187 RepID=UPI00307A76CD
MIGLAILLLCPNISEGAETDSKTDISDISWKRVTQRTQLIPADLEKFDLHLKTSSYMRSNDAILVMFHNKEERAVGGILIIFSNAVVYDLLLCHDLIEVRIFSKYLIPAEIDKHWVIEKNGYGIRIRCNGVLVLDTTVSSRTCDSKWSDQSKYWGQKVSSIRFSIGDSYDTATNYYYIDSVAESDEIEIKTKKTSAMTIIIIIVVILFVGVVGVYVYHDNCKDIAVQNNMREEPVFSAPPDNMREEPVFSAPPDNMREEPVFSAPPDNMQEEPVFLDQTLSNVAPPKYEETVLAYDEENVPSYEDVMGYDDGDGGYDCGGGYGGGDGGD